jgi:hypothetical protein
VCKSCVVEKHRMAYKVKDGGNGWGYMNRRGDVIIPLQFEWARPFNHHQATVKLQGKEMTIDPSGNLF